MDDLDSDDDSSNHGEEEDDGEDFDDLGLKKAEKSDVLPVLCCAKIKD